MLENTMRALNELKNKEIKISKTTKGECIHQTMRNSIGAELRSALSADLMEIFPYSEQAGDIVAYLTEDGVVLEVPNESVQDQLTSPIGSGAITLEIGFTVKSLEYNAQDESEAFKIVLADKEANAKKKAEEKARKIAKSEAFREAQKARLNKKGD